MIGRPCIPITSAEQIYLLELIKAAEADNAFMGKLLNTIGSFGMSQIGTARARLAEMHEKEKVNDI